MLNGDLRGDILTLSTAGKLIHLSDAPFYWTTINSSVSPDGKLLAYEHLASDDDTVVENLLVIISINGQVQAKLNWNDDWDRLLGWSDNEHLLIGHLDLTWVGAYWVNPFTGQQQLLKPSLPDFYQKPDREKWYFWDVSYDPTLTWVGYVRENKKT